MSKAHSNENNDATPPATAQTFAEVIEEVYKRKGNRASRYSELTGHEQGVVDSTIRAIESQNKRLVASEHAAAVQNAAQLANTYGLQTVITAIHRYVDESSKPSPFSQPTQSFDQVFRAIRGRNIGNTASRYYQLIPHEQGVVDMTIQAIETQSARGQHAEAVENGVTIA